MTLSADVVIAGTLAPTVGGIAAAIDDQAAGLRAAGVRVVTVNTGARRRRHPGKAVAENVGAALMDGVRVAREARRTGAPIVDIHTVGSPLLPTLRALALVLAARAVGAMTVVHLHGYDLDTILRRPPAAYGRALRFLVRRARAVIALDEHLAYAVRTHAGGHVIAIPNCVPMPAETDRTDRSASARLVFVGTVGERKGVADLLAALRTLNDDVVCDVIGGGAEEGPAAFERVVSAAADLAAVGRVRFHGEVDRDVARGALAAADVFVLPSRAEGMPLALLEAMASGLPVIVSDVGAMGRVVRDAACGMVIGAGDVPALSGAISQLVSDAALRRELGAAGRQAARERFSCTSTVGALLGVYRDIVGDAFPSPPVPPSASM